MTHLNKLKQTYMFAALNTKEAHSKQKHNDIPKFKIRDFIMIKIFLQNINLGCKVYSKFHSSKTNRQRTARNC